VWLAVRRDVEAEDRCHVRTVVNARSYSVDPRGEKTITLLSVVSAAIITGPVFYLVYMTAREARREKPEAPPPL
jgi:hypothetical protein